LGYLRGGLGFEVSKMEDLSKRSIYIPSCNLNSKLLFLLIQLLFSWNTSNAPLLNI